MEKSLTGIQHLKEQDLIDILKQHFAKFGHGFKKITFAIDQAERDKPRFEVDIQLSPLNKPRKRPKVEAIYTELMDLCKGTTQAEAAALERIYALAREDKITADEFIDLVNRVKGQ